MTGFPSEQTSYLRGKRYNAEKAGHGGDRKSSRKKCDLKTSEKLAAEYKTSKRSIEGDGQFAAAVDAIAENVGP